MSDISLKDIETLISSGKLTDADLRVLEAQLNKLEKLKEKELCSTRFIKFVEKVWPTFISGAMSLKKSRQSALIGGGTGNNG